MNLEDFSLHILDLLENSTSAGAKTITLQIIEDIEKDKMKIIIEDDGCGMDEEKAKLIVDPFVTSRKTRKVGLGLPLFADRARETGGEVKIASKPGFGTKVKGVFGWAHWDRPPLGNIVQTIITFIQGNPEVDIIYFHRVNDRFFEFNSREYREILEDVPLNNPEVLQFIEEKIANELKKIRPENFL